MCVCVSNNCVCLVLLYDCMYHCVLDVQRLSFNFVQTCKLHTYSTVCSNCIQVCNPRCYCRTTYCLVHCKVPFLLCHCVMHGRTYILIDKNTCAVISPLVGPWTYCTLHALLQTVTRSDVCLCTPLSFIAGCCSG